MDFKKKIDRLDEILEKIESKDISLEESMKLYEEATSLIKECEKEIKEAESKIEKIIEK